MTRRAGLSAARPARSRVVITGLGTVNALALDLPGTWAALAAGRSGISALNIPDLVRLSVKIGAQIHGWTPDLAALSGGLSAREASLFDPFTQYALAAAREALAMANAGASRPLVVMDAAAGRTTGAQALGQGIGVIIGSAAGGIHTWEENYRAVFQDDKPRVPPMVVPRLMHNAAPAHIAMRYGLTGPNYAVASACASATHAIGQAFRLVAEGHAPAMVAGGAEAMLLFGGLKAWEGLRVMSPDACRPFDARRNGMVMGEGAGIVVLEAADHAQARGARVLAEVAGFGMTSDAHDLLTPSVEGAARAMAQALAEAGLAPKDVGYINAHGTGTRANDATEVAAIRQVFGASAEGLMVSSTKAAHGHAMGAAGALEVMACVLALHKGVIAPTCGLETADPSCDLDHVPNHARQAAVGAALSNSFAFGGTNAVLALRGAAD